MPKTCYVMMPYGGDDPKQIARFMGVYENIISAAAKTAGFLEDEIIREDHSGDAGTITRNIVNHIKDAEILIADLTGGNANVYYELGISHVFHKSSTVLICDKSSKAVFDVKHLNIIEYSTDIDEMGSSRDRIAEAIRRRLQKKTSSDGPVHEAIPQLPQHLTDWIDSGDDEQRSRIAALEKDKEMLLRQLERAGISIESTKSKRRSLQAIIQSGVAALPYSGSMAVEKIKTLAERGEYEGLLTFIGEVVAHGRITKSDAASILEAGEKTGNLVVTECVTEVVADLFPDDTGFKAKLAMIYARQPDKRDDAVELVNSALGLRKDENGEYAEVDLSKLNHNNLARFFDTYLSIELYDDLVDAAWFLLDHGASQERPIILRNIFTALTRSKKFDEAEKLLPDIEAMKTDYSYYLVAKFYEEKGDMKNAYVYYEMAMIADPEDADYPRFIGVLMLNENLVRHGDKIEAVPSKEAQRAAAAFLFYCVRVAKETADVNAAQQVLSIVGRKRNGLTQYESVVVAFWKGEIDELPFEETDPEPLQDCLKQIGH